MADPADDAVPTSLFGGKLLLQQAATGHRAGTDAVLLAAAAAVGPGTVFADVGAGVGTVGLGLAAREPSATGLLIERSPVLAGLATGNVALNGFSGRVNVASFDIFDKKARAAWAEKADLVVSNPPFYAAAQNRVSPDAVKAAAHVLASRFGDGVPGHGDWLRAMLALLHPGGTLVMIHRPEALPQLLAGADGRLGQLRVRPVQAREGQPAIRILFGGIKGSRAPLALEAPLILHGNQSGFTAETEAMHRGELLCPLLGTKKSRPRGPAS